MKKLSVARDNEILKTFSTTHNASDTDSTSGASNKLPLCVDFLSYYFSVFLRYLCAPNSIHNFPGVGGGFMCNARSVDGYQVANISIRMCDGAET